MRAQPARSEREPVTASSPHWPSYRTLSTATRTCNKLRLVNWLTGEAW